MRAALFPFSAIVGQERLKTALLIGTVEPRVGGVLVRGEKGTAKSTAVRALAALLPPIAAVAGCPLACDPRAPAGLCPVCGEATGRRPAAVLRPVRVLTLPLNATEDQVAGGIDFERSLQTGRRLFQPGLLGKVHRGILYIDEVNLLDDHLVDIVLDAAASGVNRVEREGISVQHPAHFLLVGTMNPEEGALRPQLLDRFGLCVDVVGEADLERRQTLMARREAFDADPIGFAAAWQTEERRLAQQIAAARECLPAVTVSAADRLAIAALCRAALSAGHRAELVLERAAAALAAWNGRDRLAASDIETAAELVLIHRRRQAPAAAEPPGRHAPESAEAPPEQPGSERVEERPPRAEGGSPSPSREAQIEERIFAVGATFKVKRIAPAADRRARRGVGRRSASRTLQRTGRYVRSRPGELPCDVALDATLRAAAPFQRLRRGSPGPAVRILKSDIRCKVRERRIGSEVIFLVDASGSMGARRRMSAAKGAVMSLLLDAYRMRDRVALVGFRRQTADLLLPPTNSVAVAARLLKDLPTGGRTPLAAGLACAYDLARRRLYKNPLLRPIIITLTDGRGNVSLKPNASPVEEALSIAARLRADSRMTWVVVDTESNGYMRLGLAGRLARALGARLFSIDSLRADDLIRVVKEIQRE